MMVVVRTCINHLHTPLLQQQLAESGSLRTAPSEREAKEKIAEILEILNSKKALTSGLTELFRADSYQDINLIFKILKNFLSEARVLNEINALEEATPLTAYLAAEPIEKDETVGLTFATHPIEQCIDHLISTNNDKNRLIAECIHELLNFATETFIAQSIAKESNTEGKQNFLDANGIGTLFGPVINTLLVGKTDDIDCMTRINRLIASAICRRKEALAEVETGGSVKNFKVIHPTAYAENTNLLLAEINYAEFQKLQQDFRSSFEQILPKFIQITKRSDFMGKEKARLTQIYLNKHEYEKIMQILNNRLNSIETECSHQLEALKATYNEIQQINQLLTDLNGGQDLELIESEIESMEYFEQTKTIPESRTTSKIFVKETSKITEEDGEEISDAQYTP